MAAQDPRVVEFHRLHASGIFVMPNPWDVGSAKVLEQLGFPALATTSAGYAWTVGTVGQRRAVSRRCWRTCGRCAPRCRCR